MKAEAVSCSIFTSAPSGLPRASSARFSREMLQRRLKKRARAWRVFLAVMQVGGWGRGGQGRVRARVQVRVYLFLFCICLFICGEDRGVTFVLFCFCVYLFVCFFIARVFVFRLVHLFIFSTCEGENCLSKMYVSFLSVHAGKREALRPTAAIV